MVRSCHLFILGDHTISPACCPKVKQCQWLGGMDSPVAENTHKPEEAAQGNPQAPVCQPPAQCRLGVQSMGYSTQQPWLDPLSSNY